MTPAAQPPARASACGCIVDGLIEDELILGLPRQVCFDQQCANMPELRFVDKDSEAAEDEASDRQLPFQGLRELVANNRPVKNRGEQEID